MQTFSILVSYFICLLFLVNALLHVFTRIRTHFTSKPKTRYLDDDHSSLGRLSFSSDTQAQPMDISQVDTKHIQSDISIEEGITASYDGRSWRIVINGDHYSGTGEIPLFDIQRGVLYIDNRPYPAIHSKDSETLELLLVLEGSPLSVTTSNSLRVVGSIQGDVRAGGNVILNGSIQGDVKSTGSVECSNVYGDVTSSSKVSVQGNIHGDVMSTKLKY